MSSRRRSGARTIVVLAIAIFLLPVGYGAAWYYTLHNAGLTSGSTFPSRTSPAPFVIVETTSGESTWNAPSGTIVARRADFVTVILWCAGYELEVKEITLFR